MSEQKIWAEGFYFDRRENAPDFVIGRIGIDRERFIAWLMKQPVSDRGYLNINVTRSKDGLKYSASLDTWQPSAPKGSSAPRKVADNAYARRDDTPYDDQIPW
jgi:hypothetical protein